MRLWSIHPSYLDAKGLVALWRETLLAKAVLEDKTKGYKNHSQLVRFKACKDPISAINQYLLEVAHEAYIRGYEFDIAKVGPVKEPQTITVTKDQLAYEYMHLQNKLQTRDINKYNYNLSLHPYSAFSIFNIVEGAIESWEVIK